LLSVRVTVDGAAAYGGSCAEGFTLRAMCCQLSSPSSCRVPLPASLQSALAQHTCMQRLRFLVNYPYPECGEHNAPFPIDQAMFRSMVLVDTACAANGYDDVVLRPTLSNCVQPRPSACLWHATRCLPIPSCLFSPCICHLTTPSHVLHF